MKPIPQTLEAIATLTRTTGELTLLADLQHMADQVQHLVPDCLGLSMAWAAQDVTFTLVATDLEIAILEALHHVRGAPVSEPPTAAGQLTAEERWQLAALGTAARGVRSTLTLPINARGLMVGTVALYGASDRAFDHQQVALAEVLGAWSPGAIRNADMSFESRDRAEHAPDALRSYGELDRAVGVVAALRGLDMDAASFHLHDAARRAGISELALAHALMSIYRQHP